jgi:hypothetical protein
MGGNDVPVQARDLILTPLYARPGHRVHVRDRLERREAREFEPVVTRLGGEVEADRVVEPPRCGEFRTRIGGVDRDREDRAERAERTLSERPRRARQERAVSVGVRILVRQLSSQR